ncbi:MAG: hypothetical protein JST28_17645 [Acidobacteria bacterium]|nr:hypothetical protein [Acidobacteriota bacterium]
MTEPRETVRPPANSGRCSNPPQTVTETPYDWAYLLKCEKCGQEGGEGWALLSQQSHCNRILNPNERLLQRGGWCYVYVHNCGAAQQGDGAREMRLNDRLRASVAQFPEHLRRLVDDEPPAEIFDPTLNRAAVDVADVGEEDAAQLNERKRSQLIFSLLCAARNLAQDRFRARHATDRGSFLYCGECQAEVDSDPLRRAHEHHKDCKTGLVLVILSELAKLPKAADRIGMHYCHACGLTDAAWVAEEMDQARAEAYGLAPNQRCEMITCSRRRVHTHLCPDLLAGIGGAA